MSNDIQYTKDELQALVKNTKYRCTEIEMKIKWAQNEVKINELKLEMLRNHEANLNKIIETLE